MGQILIRNLDDAVLDALRARAAQAFVQAAQAHPVYGRSINAL